MDANMERRHHIHTAAIFRGADLRPSTSTSGLHRTGVEQPESQRINTLPEKYYPCAPKTEQKEPTYDRSARTMSKTSTSTTATHDFPCHSRRQTKEYPIIEIPSERNEALSCFVFSLIVTIISGRTPTAGQMTFFLLSSSSLFLAIPFSPHHLIRMHCKAFQRAHDGVHRERRTHGRRKEQLPISLID